MEWFDHHPSAISAGAAIVQALAAAVIVYLTFRLVRATDILAARHDKGRVDAIVRLFGGLCYFVQLSDHYGGADFSYTVVCDAQRGELNEVLQSHVDAEMLETEDVATSGETVWDDLAVSGERFINFLDSEIQSKIERDRAELKAKLPNGRNETKEEDQLS